MDMQKLTEKLSQNAPPKKKPCDGCKGKTPTLEDRIVQLGKSNRSMVAIWTQDEKGEIAFTVHRDDYPVDDLQPAAEQFSKAQFEEYVRSLAREANS